MCGIMQSQGNYSWPNTMPSSSQTADTNVPPQRQQTCSSACSHQGEPTSGIVLHDILSKISEEDENVENLRINRASEETELNGDKSHCDETHYLLSGSLATNDSTHCSPNSLPIDVLCKT